MTEWAVWIIVLFMLGYYLGHRAATKVMEEKMKMIARSREEDRDDIYV